MGTLNCEFTKLVTDNYYFKLKGKNINSCKMTRGPVAIGPHWAVQLSSNQIYKYI